MPRAPTTSGESSHNRYAVLAALEGSAGSTRTTVGARHKTRQTKTTKATVVQTAAEKNVIATVRHLSAERQAHLLHAITDPVTQEIFENPYSLPCGHTYSAITIAQQLDFAHFEKFCCAVCRDKFRKSDLQINYALRGVIDSLGAPAAHKDVLRPQMAPTSKRTRVELSGAEPSDLECCVALGSLMILCVLGGVAVGRYGFTHTSGNCSAHAAQYGQRSTLFLRGLFESLNVSANRP